MKPSQKSARHPGNAGLNVLIDISRPRPTRASQKRKNEARKIGKTHAPFQFDVEGRK
jgi:hypothetical protein